MRTITKTALALGFLSAMSVGATSIGAATIGGITPAAAFEIDAPGVHVRVGEHHRYYGGPRYYDNDRGYGRGYYDYSPCPRGFTVQDGVCKPYRGY